MSTASLHPAQALHEPGPSLPIIPAVDHFAGNEKFITKAFSLQTSLAFSFDVTLDLEDGAPVGKEKEQAQLVMKLLHEAPTIKHTGVRIHDFQSAFWKQDLDIFFAEAPRETRYLCLPKSADAAMLADWIQSIESMAEKAGWTTIPKLHVLIETPKAIEEVWQIASLPHLEVLDFGIMDFISCYHGAIPASCMRSPGQFSHHLLQRARVAICNAALAHGLVPSHSVTVDLQSGQQAWKDATIAHQDYGFLRMWSIHPNQIQQIASALMPDARRLQEASAILIAGMAASWGPARIHNQLHDRASYRYYWYLLKRAHGQGLPIPEEAQFFFENQAS